MLTPAYIRRRIAHRPNLVKIVDNIGWLFLDRVLRIAMGLFVGIWVARYLGPEQFGLLNYATAFVAMFGSIATLGLNGIVVRDLVKDPQASPVTLGTAFILQLFGGIVAFATIVTTVIWLRPEDAMTRTVVAIIACTLIFKSSDVIKYWYESQVASRYSVIVENSVFLLIAAVKVAMIFAQAPLIAFVWAVLAETALVCLGLFTMYVIRERGLSDWTLRLDRAKSLLQDSWPLILSGIAVMIYMRVDQLMLKEMAGAEAVGIYSAALRISEAWYTVPTLVTASLFPSIIESKRHSEAHHIGCRVARCDIIWAPLCRGCACANDPWVGRHLYLSRRRQWEMVYPPRHDPIIVLSNADRSHPKHPAKPCIDPRSWG
jgi:O-antigen/teichoic acid export membrane protein